jgi:hypothetical protein
MMFRQGHTMRLTAHVKNERGAALVIGLMFLAIVALAGSTAVILTSTDIRIGSNYRSSSVAFYDAEAGVNYAIAEMEKGMKADPSTFSLPTNTGDHADPNDANSVRIDNNSSFNPPSGSGFNFYYRAPGLTKVDENLYCFTSVGTGPENAIAIITTFLKRGSVVTMGLFGDELVHVHNSANVYSYSHSDNPTPAAGDSSGEAGVGSNVSVLLKNSSFVDGSVALGEDASGDNATLTTYSGAIYAREEDVDRIDPDPLGLRGGDYANKFTAAISSNLNCCGENYADYPTICDQRYVFGTPDDEEEIRDDNEIDIADDLTLKGKAGGAIYYFTDIIVRTGTTLYIDTTDGPVDIYLPGGLECKNSSNITNTAGDENCPADEDDPCCSCGSSCTPGAPSDFSIFANSLTDAIVIKNSAEFHGFIYAPYMDVDLKNSADFYGAVMAQSIVMHNSFDFYFDTDLKTNGPPSNDLHMTAWRQVVN